MKIKPLFHLLTVAALLAFLSGCEEEESSQLRFSHYLHVEDNGMDCSDCHGEVGTPSFNNVTHETCLECHDEPDAEEISVDTCGMCHQEKQLAEFTVPAEGEETVPEAYAATETPSRHIFVHTEALEGKCTECHGSLLNEDLEVVPGLKRSDIIAIRDRAHGSGQDCSTCHVDMDPAVPPLSHDMAWMKRHGAYFSQDDASCSVCHTQDSCSDCHSVMQPASHNNLWRMKTHGVQASWDRQTCAVCHTEDSCVACHSQTQPRSHRGRWAASGKYPTHCISCHTEATPGEGCVACHEDGNNVLLHEKYWPPVHNLLGDTANCYQCHTFGKF